MQGGVNMVMKGANIPDGLFHTIDASQQYNITSFRMGTIVNFDK
jgi:hypothetical protein